MQYAGQKMQLQCVTGINVTLEITFKGIFLRLAAILFPFCEHAQPSLSLYVPFSSFSSSGFSMKPNRPLDSSCLHSILFCSVQSTVHTKGMNVTLPCCTSLQAFLLRSRNPSHNPSSFPLAVHTSSLWQQKRHITLESSFKLSKTQPGLLI